jgi:hypothetical protein
MGFSDAFVDLFAAKSNLRERPELPDRPQTSQLRHGLLSASAAEIGVRCSLKTESFLEAKAQAFEYSARFVSKGYRRS